MRYKNTTNFILPIGGRDTLRPHAISREFTPKEIEDNNELQRRKLMGHIVEYTGPIDEPTPKKKKQDIRYEVDPTMFNGQVITSSAKGAKQPVQYVVADSNTADSISIESEGTVSSIGKDSSKYADYIENGVDASKFKNGADAMEAELTQEFKDSTFDDEETLSENESERPEGLDADEAIASDATEFLQKRGRDGASVTTAKAMIEQAVTSEMNKVNKDLAQNLDQGEVTTQTTTGKVADFLKQPLNAKKFIIAKETDSTFLKEVDTISQSETVKQLVKQRLEEIR